MSDDNGGKVPLPRRELTEDEKKMIEQRVRQNVQSIRIGVGLNKNNGRVALQFSHAVNMLELTPDAAEEIARNMKKKAKKARVLIEEMIKEGREPGMPQATRLIQPATHIPPMFNPLKTR